MKNALPHALLCALLAAACTRAEEEKKPVEPEKKPAVEAAKLDLKTDKDIASYALGLNYGMGAKQLAGDLDVDAMAASFADAMVGKESKLSDEEMGKMFAVFQAFMEKKQKGDKTAVLENKSGVSQALGRNMGRRLSFAAASLNAELAAKAFASAAKGETVSFNPEEHKDAIGKYFKAIQETMIAKNKEAGVKNQKESDDFMAENKKKEGVVATASGLQYKILKEGKGEIPKPTDSVQVNYEGRFLDGKVFDSTAKHGKPFDTDLVHLIPGWVEALKMMPVGSKWQLYVPGNLAYGENGSPPDIPASKMLIFDMELLNIKKVEPAAVPPVPPVKPEPVKPEPTK